MIHDYGWVRMSDWAAWRDTAAGTRLVQNPDAMPCAT